MLVALNERSPAPSKNELAREFQKIVDEALERDTNDQVLSSQIFFASNLDKME